ncbi:hypothetical protein [Haloarchaeobius sp. TZWWS8]|uniref:hypothetical protein n=1 Tax=Haloarchaeobius sp. TZWWS8 TaxID=3446121 RepID=UPI003EB6B55C
MPELTISEEQREFLESLRTEIQAEVRYGKVRPRDALQYLIDTHDTDELDLDVEAPGSSPAQEDEADWAESADDGDDTDDTDAESSESDESEASSDDDGDDSGEDRLNAMMNLMDTHDDKWREASKEDARYEVDMPDGTTEYVQTKDDVRAHLFKNY